MRTIAVKVIPNARKNCITIDGDKLKIHVMAPAVDGKANKAVAEMLAGHLGVKKNAVKLLKGERSREKVFEVEGDED